MAHVDRDGLFAVCQKGAAVGRLAIGATTVAAGGCHVANHGAGTTATATTATVTLETIGRKKRKKYASMFT